MDAGALMISEQSVAVPMPPSTNTLFLNIPGRGRIKNKKYRDWQLEAIPVIREKLDKYEGEVTIRYVLHLGSSFRGDISNRIKAAEDAIVEAGVIEGDTHRTVAEFSVHRQYLPKNVKDSYMVIYIYQNKI